MKQVGEVGLRRWLGFAGDLGTWGNFTHRLDGDKGDGTVALSIVAGVARPPRVVFRGGDCVAAYERSGFGGFTPSGGRWCCSGTAAVGPA